jgi:FtsP/CotA-like multicopper oxidase with cupredoxin domain
LVSTNETEQLEKGLYGALVVRGPDEPVVDAEQVPVLDDVKLNRRGRLARFGGWMQRHDGRRGEIRLLIGRTDATINIADGQVERWRVVNGSSSPYIRLTLGGPEFRIIGADGGLLKAPVTTTEVLLAPARPRRPGGRTVCSWHAPRGGKACLLPGDDQRRRSQVRHHRSRTQSSVARRHPVHSAPN